MLKAKLKNEVSLKLPPGLAKKLELKEGDTVEVLIEKGKLVFLDKKDNVSKIMQYAGIWQDENVDKVFLEIRKGWNKWQKSMLIPDCSCPDIKNPDSQQGKSLVQSGSITNRLMAAFFNKFNLLVCSLQFVGGETSNPQNLGALRTGLMLIADKSV